MADVAVPDTRQKASRPSTSLAQIERSVTHLLVATKSLLEVLTSWSRGTATEDQVSDVYVRLGYEFNIACRAFATSGVETADLGPVPDQLRTILEETLSQEASQASLDRFLPSIRDIVVNLLHGLKRKQARLRQKTADGGSVSSVNSQGIPPRSTSNRESRRSSIGHQIPERSRSSVSTSESSQANSTAPSLPTAPVTNGVTAPAPAIQASLPLPAPSAPPAPPPKTSQDALTALQQGPELERRASRRFSTYQISKHLAGAGPAQNSPIPNRGPPRASYIDRTSRVPANAVSDEPRITQSGVQLGPADVVNRKVSPPADPQPNLQITQALADLQRHFDTRFALLEKTISTLQAAPPPAVVPPPPLPPRANTPPQPRSPQISNRPQQMTRSIIKTISSTKPVSAPLTEAPRPKSDSPAPSAAAATAQQARASAPPATTTTPVSQASTPPPTPDYNSGPSINVEPSDTAGRAHVDRGKAKLQNDSEKVVAAVDDLQDAVEDLRKDVVTRGVRPHSRDLEVVSRDISSATAGLQRLRTFLKAEKPVWKKQWEKEMQLVCDEQDLVKMQEELYVDLEDDLQKVAATFALVEQVNQQQSLDDPKGGGPPGAIGPGNLRSGSRTFQPPQSGGDPARARDGVLGEVKALRPNHQNRLQAIERAEKMRQRELESRKEGEFQKELGNFVEEGKLKNTGGVEEVERVRLEREEKAKKEFNDHMAARMAARSAAASVAADAGGGAPQG